MKSRPPPAVLGKAPANPSIVSASHFHRKIVKIKENADSSYQNILSLWRTLNKSYLDVLTSHTKTNHL